MSATRSKILLLFISILSSIVYSQRPGTSVVLNADLSKDTISRHIYGQFAEHLGQCIYGGIWVGPGSSIPNTRGIRNDVVAALKRIKVPNLRRQNGREEPWRVKFWGVGNENWGCGGNMTAEFYADQYRRYATYCRDYGTNRVKMANIAQMINVLQAMILTDGPRMALTPTYLVYELYTVHHDAVQIPVSINPESYEFNGRAVPAISASASKDASGHINLTLVNVDPHTERVVTCDVRGASATTATGRIVTAQELSSHNSVESPDNVVTKKFEEQSIRNNVLTVRLPAKSVAAIELR